MYWVDLNTDPLGGSIKVWNAEGYWETIIPTSLKNPNAIKFTGAVTGTYDGSSAVTLNIPTIAGPKGDTGAKGEKGD
jgi:hypothetical protein